MRLPSFIAKRYLFSKKSHNVINIISIISGCAIGVGAMALIVILSVYNGFGSIISSMYEKSAPDLVIEPSRGKVLDLQEPELQQVMRLRGEGVAAFPVVEETVYIQYDTRQTVAKIRGIPDEYAAQERVAGTIMKGKFLLHDGDVKQAVVNEHLAANLMLKPSFFTPLYIFFPSRTEELSLIMPMEQLQRIKLLPGGVFRSDIPEAADLIYIPLEEARELLEYEDNECNKIEVFYGAGQSFHGAGGSKIERKIRKILSGGGYAIKNIRQQNSTMYKMMKTEKYAVYVILFFVIVIVSVNILASLSMLILDKQKDIATYHALGAHTGLLRKIFMLHGWLICMAGAIPGIILGLALCFIQYKFGIIKIPGSFLVDSYPIVVKVSDVAATFIGVAVIGFIMSFIPARAIK